MNRPKRHGMKFGKVKVGLFLLAFKEFIGVLTVYPILDIHIIQLFG